VKIALIAFLSAAASMPALAMTPAETNAWVQEATRTAANEIKYPRSAVARGFEGAAEVRLTVAQDGTVKAAELITSTGKRALDKGVLAQAVALELPALPAGETEKTVILPVQYQLQVR